MPILGVVASSKYKSTSSYSSIQTVTVTSNQSTIVFNSIPQTFATLEVRWFSFGGSYATVSTQNGTGSREHYLAGIGSGNGIAGSNSSSLAPDDSSPSTSSSPTTAVMQIIDYSSSNKLKSIRSLEGWDNNGSGTILLNSAFLDASANAITSLTFTATGGNTVFTNGTQVALYGIKG